MFRYIFDKIKGFFILEEDCNELTYNDEEDYSQFDEEDKRLTPVKRGKLVSLPNPRKSSIIIMEPSNLSEAQDVADNLKRRASVIVNLQNIDKDCAIRIIDFINGITYALGGHIQKICEEVFIFTPSSVDIVSLKRKISNPKKEQLFIK